MLNANISTTSNNGLLFLKRFHTYLTHALWRGRLAM